MTGMTFSVLAGAPVGWSSTPPQPATKGLNGVLYRSHARAAIVQSLSLCNRAPEGRMAETRFNLDGEDHTVESHGLGSFVVLNYLESRTS